jgi:hypothetical protein
MSQNKEISYIGNLKGDIINIHKEFFKFMPINLDRFNQQH